MSQEQVLSGLKKDVRSLLVSAKNGCSPEQLKKDYLNMVGHPLPLRTLGFRNVMDMVKDMPDVVAVEYSADGSLVLKVIGDSSTKGIEELVSKQRNHKPKSAVRKTGVASHLIRHPQLAPLLPRRGHAPPALPAQLRSQLRQLLSQGPITLSELEPCFARRFGRPLQVAHYGFYSIAEMLSAASDLVAIQQSRTGSLLTLKSTIRPLTQASSSTLPPKQMTPSIDKPPPDAGEKPLPSSSHRNKLELPQEASPSGTLQDGKWPSGASPPEPKPTQEEKMFENCVKKLEEELRNGILESGAAGTVSLELKEQLRQVVAQNREGLSIHDLPGEFKRVFGKDLPVAQSGFLSVTEMVSALSDILYLQPGPEKEANSWIVKDHQYSNNQQEREDHKALCATEALNPSNGSFYLSSEKSPWDGNSEGDESSRVLEEDTDIRITTKTFSQLVDTFPPTALQMRGAPVPPDAMCAERLKAPTRWKERELVPVLVERVESPSHFYVRFHETQEARALENVMIEMRSCYTCPEVAERYQLPDSYVRPGQVCCLAPRGLWFYRVLIHRVLSNSQVEVYYVDFGDVSTADRSSLKFLKSCYSELPAQAVPSSLPGVSPTSGSWSKNAVSYFQKLCCERTLVAAIHSYQKDVLYLFLCDTHTEEDVYIHTALQATGHALPCTTPYSRAIPALFNPVALYMETGVRKESIVLDSAAGCNSVSLNGQSADHSTRLESGRELASTWMGSSPESRTKVTEEEDLPDLPELEFIDIPEVNSPVQQEKANPFCALLCKDPVYCSDWDKGWMPGSTTEDTDPKPNPHTAPLCSSLKDYAEEKLSCAGAMKESPPVSPQPAQPPPNMHPLSPSTPGLGWAQSRSGGQSSAVLQQHTSGFMFPWLHHTSPTVLGPSARLAAGTHLRNWCPYKMA